MDIHLVNQKGGLWMHSVSKKGHWHPYSVTDSNYIDKRIEELKIKYPSQIYKKFKYFINNDETRKYYMEININTEEGTQTNTKNDTKVRYVKKFYFLDKLPNIPKGYNETTNDNYTEYNKFRRDVMAHTINFLSLIKNKEIQYQAEKNFKLKKPINKFKLLVENKDWGTFTKELTVIYGQKFAVLNMANSQTFGGGYLTGARAQEENMFRRTNCSLYFEDSTPQVNDSNKKIYSTKMSNIINGKNGKVYLDTDNIRVCFKDEAKYGYKLLKPEKYFPFYELRAAAINLNDPENNPFNRSKTKKRIRVQFTTLIDKNIKYVVLSAFGCGAFKNPPEIICEIYKELIFEYIDEFNVIAFAIIDAGNDIVGGNYKIFKKCFEELMML